MRKVIPAGSVGILFFFMMLPLTAPAQSLTLSSGAVVSGGSVSLNLSLTSATPVAGLQWIITYPAGASNVSVIAGAPLTAAGKSLTCISTAAGYSCIAAGMNNKGIANGVVATVSATLSGAGAVPFGVSSALGANPSGGAVAVAGVAGTVTVTPAVTISSMACNLLSLGPGAADTCTVKLSGAAGAGGVIVALSTSGSLASAASLSIPAGSNSGTFSVTAGSFITDQAATVTASLGSSSQSATLSMVAPVLPVSLTCAASSLAPNANTTCTVTLNKAAPAGGVSLAVSGAIVKVLNLPASVAVAANATAGTFSASTGAVLSTVSASIAVSLNGYRQSASLTLTASVQVSSLQCVSPALSSTASTTCTVLLTGPAAAGGAPVVLSSSNAALKAPASITVPPGGASGTFAVTTGKLAADGSSTLSASAYGSTATVSIGLSASVAISSLTCTSKSLTPGGLTNCAAKLVQAAPVGSIVSMSVSSNNAGLLVLTPLVVVPGNSAKVNFPVLGGSFSSSQTATLTASLYGISVNFQISLVVSKPLTSSISLSCPQTASPGGTAVCTINTPPSATESVRLSSSSPHLRVPALVPVRAGQSTIRFAATVDPSATPEDVVVGAGSTSGTDEAQTTVGIELPAPVVLNVPGEQIARPDSRLRFGVSASAADGLPTTLAVQDLPGGAAFDPATGTLSWTPQAADSGHRDVVFVATGATGVSTTKSVRVFVGSKPELTALQNAAGSAATAACTPNSAASLQGRFLLARESSLTERSGSQLDLGGTRVMINGTPAPVLFASASRVDFVCPPSAPGTALEIAVQSGPDLSNRLTTTMAAAAPGLLTVDDSGAAQAIAFRPDTSEVAALPNSRIPARPAVPGEVLSLVASGIACDDAFPAGRPQLQIGMHVVPAQTAALIPGLAGVCALGFQVPAGPAGDFVPVTLEVRHYDGRLDTSNQVSIAIADR